jgi:hypothetical protein
MGQQLHIAHDCPKMRDRKGKMREDMGSEGIRVKQCWHHGTVCFQVVVVFCSFLF